MGRSRFIRLSPKRRGARRAASGLLALALVLSGCGDGAETDSEKASDVEFLNVALGRELTMLDAYTRGLPRLKGRYAAVGRQLRAQEQEYVDALTKAIRGLGGEIQAEEADLDLPEAKSQTDVLAAAHELESAALASYIEAAPRLFTAAPRTLAAALAAGHAQHLVVLRQGLGAAAVDSVPEAFDGGEVPPPGEVSDPGGG